MLPGGYSSYVNLREGVYHKTINGGKRVVKSYVLYFEVLMLIGEVVFPKLAETPPWVEGFP
jgi:hypothetical protein